MGNYRLYALLLIVSQGVGIVSSASATTGECLPTGIDMQSYHCFSGSTSAADCQDDHSECADWAKIGECQENPRFMEESCRKSCDTCISGHGGNFIQIAGPAIVTAREVSARLKETANYMTTVNARILKSCENKDPQCTFWAVQGQCETNNEFMQKNCAPACHSCQ